MVRRKGERPVVKTWATWNERHPVHDMISAGDRWLDAWTAQAAISWPVLARRSGVPLGRLFAINAGAAPMIEEIRSLADVWKAPLADVCASLDMIRKRPSAGADEDGGDMRHAP